MNWFATIYGGLTAICIGHVIYSLRKGKPYEAAYYAVLVMLGVIMVIYEVLRVSG